MPCGHSILPSPHGRSGVQECLLPPVVLGQGWRHRAQPEEESAGTRLTSNCAVPCVGEQGPAGWRAWLLSEPRTCRRAAVAMACDALDACTCSWVVDAQSISQARKQTLQHNCSLALVSELSSLLGTFCQVLWSAADANLSQPNRIYAHSPSLHTGTSSQFSSGVFWRDWFSCPCSEQKKSCNGAFYLFFSFF